MWTIKLHVLLLVSKQTEAYTTGIREQAKAFTGTRTWAPEFAHLSIQLLYVFYQTICLTTILSKTRGTCVMQENGDTQKPIWIPALAEYTCVTLLFTFIFELGGTITQHDFYYHWTDQVMEPFKEPPRLPLTTLMLGLLFLCLIEFVRGVLKISAPHRVTPRGDQVNMTVGTLCTLS